MLQMASVVGKDIPVALLQVIAEPTGDELLVLNAFCRFARPVALQGE